MKFTVVTLFPDCFEGVFSSSIISRAQKKELITIEYCNLRAFGIGPHKIVDDKPDGGGTGMVLRYDVLHSAINSVRGNSKKEKVILLDSIGTPYKQSKAEEFKDLDHLIIVCGRYEGFDARI